MPSNSRINHCFVVACLLILSSESPADAQPLLEINTKKQTCFGREIVHNDKQCWLMGREGKIDSFLFSDVTGFKQLDPVFKPYSAAQMRSRLLVELGPGFEIIGTTHYLVCAAPGHGKKYGELLEQLYRESYVYFSTRSFQIKPLEFPLVTIVFPTHSQFVKYANAEGITRTSGLAGYYQLNSNRIALFDPSTSAKTAALDSPTSSTTFPLQKQSRFFKVGTSASSLQKTIIHEATHQVAFNIGLHSRLAQTPRWVVEGLAMVFEHPESRSATKISTRSQRLNRERYLRFGNYVKERRNTNSLEQFLVSDHIFQSQALDAYSEAWSLSFFLMETRSSNYAKYLKRLAERPVLKDYSAQQRLKDFHDCFGTAGKMKMFEAEYLRFIQRL